MLLLPSNSILSLCVTTTYVSVGTYSNKAQSFQGKMHKTIKVSKIQNNADTSWMQTILCAYLSDSMYFLLANVALLTFNYAMPVQGSVFTESIISYWTSTEHKMKGIEVTSTWRRSSFEGFFLFSSWSLG